jgi:hypothetical protein
MCSAAVARWIRPKPRRPIDDAAARLGLCLEATALDVYLIDGTYELFRHYYALPSARDHDGFQVAAVRGVLASVLGIISGGATHIAVATDHVIESFRNDLWPGYKTGEGIEPDLWAQFPLLEETLSAAGIVVWPMVEFEAETESPHARHARRGRSHSEIRRPTGIHPRLPRIGRGHRRWLSGPSRMGSEIDGCGSRQVWPYRIHTGGLARVACQRRQRRCAR